MLTVISSGLFSHFQASFMDCWDQKGMGRKAHPFFVTRCREFAARYPLVWSDLSSCVWSVHGASTRRDVCIRYIPAQYPRRGAPLSIHKSRRDVAFASANDRSVAGQEAC